MAYLGPGRGGRRQAPANWPRGSTERGRSGRDHPLTSGETGQPKLVAHDWETLTRRCAGPAPRARPRPARSATPYRPAPPRRAPGRSSWPPEPGDVWAWPAGLSAEELAGLMGSARSQVVCATPSYWRRLLTLVPAQELTAARPGADHPGGRAERPGPARPPQGPLPTGPLGPHVRRRASLDAAFPSRTAGRIPGQLSRRSLRRRRGAELEDGELRVRSANAMRGKP